MKIEVGKRYRSGYKEGRVIAIDRKHQTHTVIFLTDNGHIFCYTKEGFYNETPGDLDLQELPETHWVNVSRWNNKVITCSYPTKEKADKDACKDRIACVEVKEGDGL